MARIHTLSSFKSLTYLMFVEEITVHVSSFVGQNAGKLREYYRIGKMLGSGKELFATLYLLMIG